MLHPSTFEDEDTFQCRVKTREMHVNTPNNVKDNFSWGTVFLNEHLRFRYDKIRGAPCISEPVNHDEKSRNCLRYNICVFHQ